MQVSLRATIIIIIHFIYTEFFSKYKDALHDNLLEKLKTTSTEIPENSSKLTKRNRTQIYFLQNYTSEFVFNAQICEGKYLFRPLKVILKLTVL